MAITIDLSSLIEVDHGGDSLDVVGLGELAELVDVDFH